MGYPLLDARDRCFGRSKAGERQVLAAVEALNESRQDALTASVGYNHRYALFGHLTRNAGFGEHTTAPETRLSALDVFFEFHLRSYFAQHGRLGVVGVAVVYTVDVAQYHKQLSIHHGSNEARELIVVGKHKFGYRYRIVLVDDRNHIVFEHYAHTALLIEIMTASAKTFLGGEHLTHHYVVLAKELVVAIYQLCLTHSREELSLLHAVEFFESLHFAKARSHSARRHDYHFDTHLPKFRHLVYQ